MKTTLLGISIAFLSLAALDNSYAQTHDFRKGFIVGLKNDTTYGFLDYSTPFNNSQFIVFRKDSLSNVIKYLPNDIKAYAFLNSKHYASKEIPYGEARIQLFLEYLVNGILDLYYIKYTDTKHMYFIEKGGDLYQLTNDEKIVFQEGKQYEFKDQKYKGQLKFLMKDAVQRMANEINNTAFNQKSLIKLTKDYHEMVCDTAQCIVYSKKDKKMNDVKWKVNYGVGIGYMQSFLFMDSDKNYKDNTPTSFVNFNVNEVNSVFSTNTPVVLPAFTINFNRNNRISYQLELRYKYLKFSSLVIQQLSIPIIINYDFKYYKKTRPFINAGLGMDINIDTKTTNIFVEYEHYENASSPLPTHKKELLTSEAFSLWSPTASIGGGVKHDISQKNGFKFEMRFELSASRKNYALFGDGQPIITKLNYFNILFLTSYYFH